MNESGQNFEELKKLLKLKRHEIPPPGYFNHFSDGVISRIRAGEARGGTALDRLNDSAPWLVNFLRVFEARPGVVGGFATSLCLLLLFGVVLAEHSETAPKNAIGETVAAANTSTTSAVAAAGNSTMPELSGVSLASEGGIAISTNASLQPVATLFGQPAANPFLQPAAFAPAH